MESNIIYHYCSLESFYKIFTTKEIWLTNSRYFNDYAEVFGFYKLIERYLDRLNNPNLKTEILKHFQPNGTEYFVTCFSENGNSLSQWRGYAKEGSGVSIGMDVSSFGFQNIREFGIDTRVKTYYGKVEYNMKIMEGYIKNFFSSFKNTRDPVPITMKHLALVLTCYAIFYKEQSFEEEHEQRLVFVSDNLNIDNHFLEPIPPTLDRLQFAPIRNSIVPYRALQFSNIVNDEKKPYFPKFVLGPNCTLKKRDAEDFLVDCGYEADSFEVIESKITYRIL